MNLVKYSFEYRNIFSLSKNTICSLKCFPIIEKKNSLFKYGISKFKYLDKLAIIREDNMLTNSYFLNDSFFLHILKENEENPIFKKTPQELLYFKNKKTKLALRRKRKRMGERISLRYR
ncbi:conserved Plasmodium protein, unknown function [Plasmodium malariae]|uniref:Uncharacterized protein n=1 Tax=Plasmodium malariae TaxID=5858 RepID=A0A1C3KCE3_PLAMA|nr:conserved Plasmodium protein, unknown function [Plasmodium malariae]